MSRVTRQRQIFPDRLDRTFKRSQPINKQLTPTDDYDEFVAPPALPEPARLKSRFRGRKRVPMRGGGNGVRFPRRKFMRRLNLNRGTRRNGIGGSFARRKRNRKNKYGGCARCGRTLAGHNSIAAASANSILPPDTGAGGGDTFAAISSSVAVHTGNVTAATPTPSTLRPEMMAVEALSGMVSALTVAAAATTAKKAGKAAASEKHGESDAAEAEMAETVLRGIQEVAQKFEFSKER